MKNRFIKNLFLIFSSLVLFFVTGCATSPEKSKQLPSLSAITGAETGKDSFSGFPERYRLKAREDEKRGDLPKALKGWEIVKSFLPTDAEAGKRIPQLNKQIDAVTEWHFQKGLALFKSHSYGSARKEFLLTLYLKPDHAEAIQYLKQKIAGEDSISYEVKKGDTIKEVARKIYKDPQKDFLISYFNNLKVDSSIQPPMTLKIPILDLAPSKETSASTKRAADPPKMALNTKEILGKAQANYQEGNYRESATIAEKVLEYDPANRGIHELINASYYQMGKQLGLERQYQEALEAFHHVDPEYKDVNIQIAHNRKQLAEVHYIKGLKFFIEEDIENAIQEWKSTLSLEPNHPMARKDLENAHNLLKKLEKIN